VTFLQRGLLLRFHFSNILSSHTVKSKTIKDTEEGVKATETLEKQVVKEFAMMFQSNAALSSAVDHLNFSSLVHSHGIIVMNII